MIFRLSAVFAKARVTEKYFISYRLFLLFTCSNFSVKRACSAGEIVTAKLTLDICTESKCCQANSNLKYFYECESLPAEF